MLSYFLFKKEINFAVYVNGFEILKKQATTKSGIKEIASKAKVSIGTVDRVLHNRGEVSEATRKNVLKIIDELGYTPNLIAKSLASRKKYTIAVLIPNMSNISYWEKPLQGILAAANEIQKFNFEVFVSDFEYNSEASFIAKSAEIIRMKPHGFIFAPVYNESSLKVVEQCDELEIPYVFFDVFLNNCNNLAYYGQNSTQSGFLAARIMNLCVQKLPRKLFIIKPMVPSAPVYHVNLREEGFKLYFSQNYDNETVIKSAIVDISSKKNVSTCLSELLNASLLPDGIFVANSRVHYVAEFLEKNKIKNITLIGYDLLDENIRFMETDTIQFLICQKPEEQGYKSVLSLFNYLSVKKPVEKINFSAIDIIMKENLEYYKNLKY